MKYVVLAALLLLTVGSGYGNRVHCEKLAWEFSRNNPLVAYGDDVCEHRHAGHMRMYGAAGGWRYEPGKTQKQFPAQIQCERATYVAQWNKEKP